MKNKIILSLFILGRVYAPLETLPADRAKVDRVRAIACANYLNHLKGVHNDMFSMYQHMAGVHHFLDQWTSTITTRGVLPIFPKAINFRGRFKAATQTIILEEAFECDLSRFFKPKSHMEKAVALARTLNEQHNEILQTLKLRRGEMNKAPLIEDLSERASALENIQNMTSREMWTLFSATHVPAPGSKVDLIELIKALTNVNLRENTDTKLEFERVFALATLVQMIFSLSVEASQLMGLALITNGYFGSTKAFEEYMSIYSPYDAPAASFGGLEQSLQAHKAKDLYDREHYTLPLFFQYLQRILNGESTPTVVGGCKTVLASMPTIMSVDPTRDGTLLEAYLKTQDDEIRNLGAILKQIAQGRLEEIRLKAEATKNIIS